MTSETPPAVPDQRQISRDEGSLEDSPKRGGRSPAGAAKFIIFSLIGLVGFFTPIPTASGTTIPIEFVATWLGQNFTTAVTVYAVAAVIMGAALPFVLRTWKRSTFDLVFTVIKIGAVPVALLIVFNAGPDWLMDPNVGPFLFESLVVSLGIIIPVGGLLLAFITGYGLLDFLGVLTQRIMRPLWNLPGRAAVTVLVSLVASFVVGLLVTRKEYAEGRFTKRQAVIVATGFSTIAAPFMVVIAATLDLMDVFFLYFFVTIVVTVAVTAVTVRLRPISRLPDSYAIANPIPEVLVRRNYLRTAWRRAKAAADSAPSLAANVGQNFRQSLVLTCGLLPALLMIGLIGLLLVEYTPLFDWISWLFYPLMWVLQIPDPHTAALAAPIGVIEMFLPVLIAVETDIVTRFVIAVFSVSQIVFFSSSVPAFLAAGIPVSIPQMLVIWLQRTVLTFVITTPIAFLVL